MSPRWLQTIVNIENKGHKAYLDGIPSTDNPYTQGYHNQNGPGGQLQRQRWEAWQRGWLLAKTQKEEEQ